MFLYSTTIALKTNLAFIFDKATVDELRKKGIETVHYLPMAAPVAYYDSLYSSSNVRKKYQSEISFVGSLYTEDRQDQMKRLKGITQETDKYLEMLIGLQLQSYAMPIFEKFLNQAVIADLQRVCPIPLEEDEMQTDAWMYANYFLARQTTAIERTMLLEAISHEHQLKLYTPEPNAAVSQCG